MFAVRNHVRICHSYSDKKYLTIVKYRHNCDNLIKWETGLSSHKKHNHIVNLRTHLIAHYQWHQLHKGSTFVSRKLHAEKCDITMINLPPRVLKYARRIFIHNSKCPDWFLQPNKKKNKRATCVRSQSRGPRNERKTFQQRVTKALYTKDE